ncbi:54S ribosomal protein l4 [Mycena indigotica]|uniref:Large ribosomal subunit protein uL29m n=1 Tax=Mycena indigotica TaxID=2126181 RepID=A0A8H6SHZ7_9AGAR|nr:54S ribosomal protein l4 [Mycena indigotica]KAF7299021.1 54S ribosomal protein l4 [Mycena indigotica]
MLSSFLRVARPRTARSLRAFSSTVKAAASSPEQPTKDEPEHIDPIIKPYQPSSTLAFIPPSAPQLSQDHGLFGFFRRRSGENLIRDDQYETFTDPTITFNGREWQASELRVKSFKDLHTLWYVLLRERNLLATQREEMRQLGLWSMSQPPFRINRENAAKCRKSMARIKAIMNERRLAYEGAVELAQSEREAETKAAILKAKTNMETTEMHRKHAESLRNGTAKRSGRTARAGAKVRARRGGIEGEKRPRWTKEQKMQRKKERLAVQTV